MQFVIVSDSNASYFADSEFTMPVFRDPSPFPLPSWNAFRVGAVKHSTFVYDRGGRLVLDWSRSPSLFRTEIDAAVRALPK